MMKKLLNHNIKAIFLLSALPVALFAENNWLEQGFERRVESLKSNIGNDNIDNDIASVRQGLSASSWRGSIMFPQKDIAILRYKLEEGILAKKEREKQEILEEEQQQVEKALADNEGVLSEEQKMQLRNELPNFNISSIVYFNPNSWVVRIGGQRFWPDKSEDQNIRLLKVNSERVVFLWKAESLDMLIPDWRHRISIHRSNIDPERFQNSMFNDSYEPSIKVGDNDKGWIQLMLRPNQTFIGSDIDIVEGVVVR